MNILRLTLIVVLISFAISCQKKTNTLKVDFSTKPLALLMQDIGGEFVEDAQILSKENWDKNPEITKKQLKKLNKCQLVFLNGLGLEKSFIPDSTRSTLYFPCQKYVNQVALINEGNNFNPYYWLDMDMMSDVARGYYRELSLSDPKNSMRYDDKIKVFVQKFGKLTQTIKDSTTSVSQISFLTINHNLTYLTRSLNLKNITFPITSTETLNSMDAGMGSFIKDSKITTLFYISADKSLAEEVGKKFNLKTVEIDVLANDHNFQNISEYYLYLANYFISNLKVSPAK